MAGNTKGNAPDFGPPRRGWAQAIWHYHGVLTMAIESAREHLHLAKQQWDRAACDWYEPAGFRIHAGGPIGQARPVLLAAVGREPSHTAAVWEHATVDRCADVGDVGEPVRRGDGSGEIMRPRR